MSDLPRPHCVGVAFALCLAETRRGTHSRPVCLHGLLHNTIPYPLITHRPCRVSLQTPMGNTCACDSADDGVARRRPLRAPTGVCHRFVDAGTVPWASQVIVATQPPSVQVLTARESELLHTRARQFLYSIHHRDVDVYVTLTNGHFYIQSSDDLLWRARDLSRIAYMKERFGTRDIVLQTRRHRAEPDEPRLGDPFRMVPLAFHGEDRKASAVVPVATATTTKSDVELRVKTALRQFVSRNLGDGEEAEVTLNTGEFLTMGVDRLLDSDTDLTNVATISVPVAFHGEDRTAVAPSPQAASRPALHDPKDDDIRWRALWARSMLYHALEKHNERHEVIVTLATDESFVAEVGHLLDSDADFRNVVSICDLIKPQVPGGSGAPSCAKADGAKEQSALAQLGAPEPPECAICFDKPVQAAIAPCGHACACLECAIKLQERAPRTCPICRGPIASVLRLHFA